MKKYIVSLTYYYEVEADDSDGAADIAIAEHRANVDNEGANVDIDELWEENGE